MSSNDVTPDGQGLDPARAEVILQLFAHDVRGTLSGASELVDRLRDGGDLDAQQRSFLLDRVAANLGSMQDLLRDVVDLERIGRTRMDTEWVTLDRLVADALGMVPDIEHVDVDVDVAPIPVDVDRVLVARALEKLVANAVGHTPFDTRIVVRAAVREDGAVMVAVEDDGPGVPEELHEAIFEPFHRGIAPDEHAGLGLGLALVRRIAEAHGGRAWVQERRGGGASFRVLLPTVIVLDDLPRRGAASRRSRPTATLVPADGGPVRGLAS